ncbi:transglutaminase domain-containing protein [Hymenobacter algoricola]|uniref:transglutaminase-like domain-containing protein n=1 Tax=Hymenobacter algoricola TaxID=486267 RepID=UPI0031F1AABD
MLFPALTWPLLLAFAAGSLAPTGKIPTAAPLRSRTFSFDYTTRVHDLPAGARQLDLWLPVPHTDKSQDIANLKITSPYPYEILTGQYGNKVLHLQVKDPQPAGFAVTMAVQAERREHINPMLSPEPPKKAPKEAADPNMTRWLEADKLVPLDPKIRLWALEVVAKANARTDLEKAQAIYNHVVSTVTYDKTGQGWGRGDIYYACDARRGNCTDFHAVFIGYCRALGIPARFSIGFPLPPERGTGEVKGYHCWAEFFTKETGWVPVDASEAAKNPARRNYFFGAHDENRLEFSRGRDLTLNPKQQGSPLNYFIYPYAEVDGQPFAAVDKQFLYRDLTAGKK